MIVVREREREHDSGKRKREREHDSGKRKRERT